LWPSLALLQQVHVCPVLRAPELDAGLPGRSHQSGAEGQNPLPHPPGHAAGDVARAQLAFWAARAHCWVMPSR